MCMHCQSHAGFTAAADIESVPLVQEPGTWIPVGRASLEPRDLSSAQRVLPDAMGCLPKGPGYAVMSI